MLKITKYIHKLFINSFRILKLNLSITLTILKLLVTFNSIFSTDNSSHTRKTNILQCLKKKENKYPIKNI